MDLPPPVPAVTPPVAAGPVRLARATRAGAWGSLLLYLVAGLLAVIPLGMPEDIPDCGTPVSYLLQAPIDVVPTEDGRFLAEDGSVVTVSEDAAREARDRPCRERIARLAVPAGILLVVATVIGLVAFGVELFVVRPRQRRVLRAALDDGAVSPPPPPPASPPSPVP